MDRAGDSNITPPGLLWESHISERPFRDRRGLRSPGCDVAGGLKELRERYQIPNNRRALSSNIICRSSSVQRRLFITSSVERMLKAPPS